MGVETAMARILMVEDNEMNRDALSRRLKRRGYEVVLAVDGKQGLTLAQSAQPDLILMDLSLPEIDGWEATRCLKAASATAQIPLIVLSSHAMAEDRPQALERITQQPFDLVLLDVEMPVMSELDVLQVLRDTYSPTQLPII